MHTIIDLWNGNIAPCEHCGAQDSAVNHLNATVRWTVAGDGSTEPKLDFLSREKSYVRKSQKK